MEINCVTQPMALRTRSYQQEMFDRSLKGNVVVVLDTGGGKTLIAALRIKYELERCAAGQMVWFLSPGVALCVQQHKFLAEFLPWARTRLLIGSDNMDRWREKRIWDAALDQVQLVVSTHAVLSEALEHSFVKLSSLVLIVFDEAHHCIKRHKANEIMQQFYHPAKRDGNYTIPRILGLSASMVMRSNLNSLRTIEKNLDSISVTPRIHRDDLLVHVNRPVFVRLGYSREVLDQRAALGTPLANFYQLIETDQVTFVGDTSDPCRRLRSSLGKLRDKAKYIHECLGIWAANRLIARIVELCSAHPSISSPGTIGTTCMAADPLFQWVRANRLRLIGSMPDISESTALSAKACRLIDFLATQTKSTTTGIIFVERRITTSLFCDVIRAHPRTKERFHPTLLVGASSYPGKQAALLDLIDVSNQRDGLPSFRKGESNLLIATSAGEEGLDIPACSLVCCFDPPQNLKSFIQRRGRARHKHSMFAVLVDEDDDNFKIERWRYLEEEMIRICLEDHILETEHEEEEDEQAHLILRHPSSGAIITAHSAVQHVHHFCNVLPPLPYVDNRPIFSYNTDACDMIEARVSLPDSVPEVARHAISGMKWKTERLARKDVALVAYTALFRANLLNENLLPLSQDWEPVADFVEIAHGLATVAPQVNVWHGQSDFERSFRHQTCITLRSVPGSSITASLRLISSVPLAATPSLKRQWHGSQEFQIDIVPCKKPSPPPAPEELLLMRNVTALVFKSARSDRLSVDISKLSVLLAPGSCNDMEAWLEANTGQYTVQDIAGKALRSEQVVRVPLSNRPPFLFRRWITGPGSSLSVACEPFKRHRGGSTHTQKQSNLSSETTPQKQGMIFPAESCEFDRVDFCYAQLSHYLPQIVYQLHDYTIATMMRKAVLYDLPYKDIIHTVSALCASQANRETNYQHYEFVGDAVLKFIVSHNLYAQHWTWPEGFLSKRRAHLVCNQRLASEAIKLGLDRYIITGPTLRKDWTLPVLDDQSEDRHLPVKVLADVVEALIGATFEDHDMDLNATRACVHRLIPAISFEVGELRLPPPSPSTIFLSGAEDLVGRSFKHKGLLAEAFTLSNGGGHCQGQSYQRLEFLGDSVLDMLIVTNALRYLKTGEQLSPGRMTALKAVLVNADVLGYFCLSFKRQKTVKTVYTDPVTGEFTVEPDQQDLRLWKFMRHNPEQVTAAQQRVNKRYERLGAKIARKMQEEANLTHPWAELLELQPEKFYSDLIESILGAIFVDSDGDLGTCQAFLDRIGLTAYLDRLMRCSIDVSHPRDKLQKLTQSKPVEYKVEVEQQVNATSSRTFGGSLVIDEVVVAATAMASSADLAIVRLANAGIDHLCSKMVQSLSL